MRHYSTFDEGIERKGAWEKKKNKKEKLKEKKLLKKKLQLLREKKIDEKEKQEGGPASTIQQICMIFRRPVYILLVFGLSAL